MNNLKIIKRHGFVKFLDTLCQVVLEKKVCHPQQWMKVSLQRTLEDLGHDHNWKTSTDGGTDTLTFTDAIENGISHIHLVLRASLVIQLIKNLSVRQETRVQFLGREVPLEKG